MSAAEETPRPPAPPYAVREAGAEDVAAVAELEQRAFGPDAWSQPTVAAELTAQGRRSLVAHVGGRMVGYAVTWVVDDVADLQRVVVADEARRSGVATRLVQELIARTVADGAHRVLLEVSATNQAALASYAALGFAEIDRRAAYYRDGSDALVLQLAPELATGEETS